MRMIIHLLPNIITAGVCAVIGRSWTAVIIGSAVCGIAVGLARSLP